jgi:hypothetical protein
MPVGIGLKPVHEEKRVLMARTCVLVSIAHYGLLEHYYSVDFS